MGRAVWGDEVVSSWGCSRRSGSGGVWCGGRLCIGGACRGRNNLSVGGDREVGSVGVHH